MADFIDSIKQNPVAIAIAAVLLGILIWVISKQVKGGTSLGASSGSIVPGSNIDPNTGLPYPSTTPNTVNNFTSYPIVQTLPGVPGPAGPQGPQGPGGTTSSAYLAYIRARGNSPSVQAYDKAFSQGVPIRDVDGNVTGYAPYGQSIQVTGNPIAGSSNLPGTTAGANQWLPVSTGSTNGYVSSFDLTGLQQGANVDPSKVLHIGSTPPPVVTPTPVPTAPVSQPAKVTPKYVTASAWPSPNSTLSGIASANGKSLSAIELLNPQIKDPNTIYAGQSIRVS